jgi:hypothetical protein
VREQIWFDAFESVAKKGESGALEWALPEPWVHAELYSELKRIQGRSGWNPFPVEVPYFTKSPVAPRKGKTEGVKWADLALRSQEDGDWCFFEFKVRHVGRGGRIDLAARSARDAFKKDIVGLMGLDVGETAYTWKNPDRWTSIYWIDEHLTHRIEQLKKSKIYCSAGLLQLEGAHARDSLCSEEFLVPEIKKWAGCRNLSEIPKIVITQKEISNHLLTLVSWQHIAVA